jgi:hypothetical protein
MPRINNRVIINDVCAIPLRELVPSKSVVCVNHIGSHIEWIGPESVVAHFFVKTQGNPISLSKRLLGAGCRLKISKLGASLISPLAHVRIRIVSCVSQLLDHIIVAHIITRSPRRIDKICKPLNGGTSVPYHPAHVRNIVVSKLKIILYHRHDCARDVRDKVGNIKSSIEGGAKVEQADQRRGVALEARVDVSHGRTDVLVALLAKLLINLVQVEKEIGNSQNRRRGCDCAKRYMRILGTQPCCAATDVGAAKDDDLCNVVLLLQGLNHGNIVSKSLINAQSLQVLIVARRLRCALEAVLNSSKKHTAMLLSVVVHLPLSHTTTSFTFLSQLNEERAGAAPQSVVHPISLLPCLIIGSPKVIVSLIKPQLTNARRGHICSRSAGGVHSLTVTAAGLQSAEKVGFRHTAGAGQSQHNEERHQCDAH